MPLNMYDLFTSICDNNDHILALEVLQVIGRIRRSGYITIQEQLACLSYSANTFAERANLDFFKEFIMYIPNITIDNNLNPFSRLSRSYYFALTKCNEILLQYCPNVYVECNMWFRDFVISRCIYKKESIHQLLTDANESNVSAESFKELCNNYIFPVVMRTG